MASVSLPYPPKKEDLPIPFPEGSDYTKQSIEVPGTRKPGQTGAYRVSAWPDLPTIYSSPIFPKTAFEVFNRGLALSGPEPCLGHRPVDPKTGDLTHRYVWQSYEEVDKRRRAIGSGIYKLAEEHGFANDEHGWRIGLWSHNRPEWQIISKACDAYSFVTVSLYDTLGPNVVEYCINHSSVQIAFANPIHIPSLLYLAQSKKCPSLKIIVSMESLDGIPGLEEKTSKATGTSTKKEVLKNLGRASLEEDGKSGGVLVMDFAEVEALGMAYLRPPIPPTPKAYSSICYTSGTTGAPKGVVLTHEMFAQSVVSNLHGSGLQASGELLMSFLPLSHIYERFIEDIAFSLGMPIGFACGDNTRLIEDIQVLRPTMIALVPRVLNRVYQLVKGKTIDAPGVRGALMKKIFDTKLQNLKEHGVITHPVYDLVLRKVRAALGGRLRFIGTGSAPIDPTVLDFVKIAFSTDIQEGYGQTETMGTTTRGWTGDHKAGGTTGPPQCGVEVKLVDVPDMGYHSTDKPNPRGEVCTRGLGTFFSYYKDEKKTKETIDEDGWMHTGDVGEIDSCGRVKIIDRIKNLLKLSQGEYVALEKVENVYSLCPFVAQVYVHGDSLRDHVVAIVVPEGEALVELAARKRIQAKPPHYQGGPPDAETYAQLCKNPAINAAILAAMEELAEQAKLRSFERAKVIHLETEAFSPENDLLTPTLKLKRNIAAQKFKPVIERLYAQTGNSKAKL